MKTMLPISWRITGDRAKARTGIHDDFDPSRTPRRVERVHLNKGRTGRFPTLAPVSPRNR